MKVYRSKPVSNRRKTILGAGICAVAVLIATAVTLGVVLGKKDRKPVVVPPVINAGTTVATYQVPVSSYKLGMQFSMDKLVYHKSLNQWRTHSGVDFIAPAGTDVVAIADGTVDKVENTNLEGTVVTIRHENNLVSIYKSLDSNVAVKQGDKVMRGDKIGTVSASMLIEQAEGAHLHLETKVADAFVDPMDYFPESGDK